MQQKFKLSEEELERTKRQKLIQGWDQSVLKQSTVFIAGVGALGCEIGKDLALAGIGKLILCDLDKIETSNLSRQMLFYKGDEGRYKAEVGAERLRLMNPFLETEVFTIPLQKIPMNKYKECKVVIAALDNVQARMDLNKFCLKLGIPLIEGGTVGFEGHVQVIIPEKTRTIKGEPFPIGNRDRAIEQLTEEKLDQLQIELQSENSEYRDQKIYSDYLEAQTQINHLESKISELENQIEAIKDAKIEPVEKIFRQQAQADLESNPKKYIYSTPCYRCVVPIPPPLHNQVAACTLKGIPRTREHCAIRGEVLFIKKHERKPEYSDKEDMSETLKYAQLELEELRTRVLHESIPPELEGQVSTEELNRIAKNIYETFGGDFALEDMENILGNKIPAIQTVSSIISSIQSQETLKILFRMENKDIGPVMDPPYINYNGTYGLFEQIPIQRLPDCVACGTGQGRENLNVVVPVDAKVKDLFRAISEIQPLINMEQWIITHSVSKRFIYNPMFEKGRTNEQTLQNLEIQNLDELILTPFGAAKENGDIKQYNVIIQMM
ncbi:MAG: ThiF family adenylyltransferase [Promethearchaeota archaeon]